MGGQFLSPSDRYRRQRSSSRGARYSRRCVGWNAKDVLSPAGARVKVTTVLSSTGSRPRSTSLVVLILALGIGANTIFFGVFLKRSFLNRYHALPPKTSCFGAESVIQPWPRVSHSGRLPRLSSATRRYSGTDRNPSSYPERLAAEPVWWEFGAFTYRTWSMNMETIGVARAPDSFPGRL